MQLPLSLTIILKTRVPYLGSVDADIWDGKQLPQPSVPENIVRAFCS